MTATPVTSSEAAAADSTAPATSPNHPASAPIERKFGTIARGTAEFTRTNRALFLGGFSTFSLLYCVQPLLPQFSEEFALTPAQSSATLSVATGTLALCLLLVGAISDRIGRKKLMCCALMVSALLTVLCAFSTTYHQLLALRVLVGLTAAGVPAVAMAYLSEEIEPLSLGASMGLYIGGSASGGMAGRVVSAWIADAFSWRVALGFIGVTGVLAAIEFARSLPKSRNFQPRGLTPRAIVQGIRGHFRDDGLPWLFVSAFLLMACFVSLYNYIAFRLMGPEFNLRPATVGTIFLEYLVGVLGAVWSGALAERFGRRNMLWVLISVMLAGLVLTLSSHLLLILIGIGMFTFGFFGAHSVASSWVGRRAKTSQALASALYLCFYYLGGSVVGTMTGMVWSGWGWLGMVLVLGAGLALSLLVALRLRKLPVLQFANKLTETAKVS